MQGLQFVDSGGGFLIEESLGSKNMNDESAKSSVAPIEKETVEMPISYKDCIECDKKFALSYLYDNFNYSVCDDCRYVHDYCT